MKTFNELQFKQHPSATYFKEQAEMEFENGYGVSVITGKGAYSSEDALFEVAVLFKGSLCYSTPITDDVLGYQTAEDVTEITRQVQLLIA